MGLFDFLKKSGNNVLTKKAAAEVSNEETKRLEEELFRQQKLILLHNVVNNLGVSVEGLKLDLKDDVVVIKGTTENQADRERVVLALGNVSGIAQVDDKIKVVNKEPKAVFYVVKKGDTLSKIAKKFYGDPMKYKDIFEANKPPLKDPNKIYPGQSIRIPNPVNKVD